MSMMMISIDVTFPKRADDYDCTFDDDDHDAGTAAARNDADNDEC